MSYCNVKIKTQTLFATALWGGRKTASSRDPLSVQFLERGAHQCRRNDFSNQEQGLAPPPQVVVIDPQCTRSLCMLLPLCVCAVQRCYTTQTLTPTRQATAEARTCCTAVPLNVAILWCGPYQERQSLTQSCARDLMRHDLELNDHLESLIRVPLLGAFAGQQQ